MVSCFATFRKLQMFLLGKSFRWSVCREVCFHVTSSNKRSNLLQKFTLLIAILMTYIPMTPHACFIYCLCNIYHILLILKQMFSVFFFFFFWTTLTRFTDKCRGLPKKALFGNTVHVQCSQSHASMRSPHFTSAITEQEMMQEGVNSNNSATVLFSITNRATFYFFLKAKKWKHA